jgi:hypothetical protein
MIFKADTLSRAWDYRMIYNNKANEKFMDFRFTNKSLIRLTKPSGITHIFAKQRFKSAKKQKTNKQ